VSALVTERVGTVGTPRLPASWQPSGRAGQL